MDKRAWNPTVIYLLICLVLSACGGNVGTSTAPVETAIAQPTAAPDTAATDAAATDMVATTVPVTNAPTEPVRVGYVVNRPPLINADGGGDQPGLALELVDQLFATVKTPFNTSADLLEAMSIGDIDVGLGALPAEIRGRNVLETQPYLCADTMAVANDDLQAQVNDKLNTLRTDGVIDTLVATYVKPERADAPWLNDEPPLTPLQFNANGYSQFCTQLTYARQRLVDVGLLLPDIGINLANLESSPDPDNDNLYIATVPVVFAGEAGPLGEKVLAGQSGPLGILLHSAQPDEAFGPPPDDTIGVIMWDAEAQTLTLRAADSTETPLEITDLQSDLEPVETITIIHVAGSVKICVRWDGYKVCAKWGQR
jgi:hypothetical protein